MALQLNRYCSWPGIMNGISSSDFLLGSVQSFPLAATHISFLTPASGVKFTTKVSSYAGRLSTTKTSALETVLFFCSALELRFARCRCQTAWLTWLIHFTNLQRAAFSARLKFSADPITMFNQKLVFFCNI